MASVVIIGKLNNSRQRRVVFDKNYYCPSLVAGMGMGGDVPLVVVTIKGEKMSTVKTIKAFSDPYYDYYKLTKDLGCLPAGAIFYHDPDDDCFGSIAEGCLKLCWTPDGNCYGRLCGGTVILHCLFAESDLFEKVDFTASNILSAFTPGHYEMSVHADGTWSVNRTGEILK